MRILYLSHRFPFPPTFGSTVRSFNTISHLAARHEVTVMAPVRSKEEAMEARGIAAHCAAFRAFPVANALQTFKMGLTLPTPVTASEAYFDSAAMRREVSCLIEEGRFDMAIAFSSSIGRVLRSATRVPKLMDFCDVDSRKWLEYAQFKPWPLSVGYQWEGRRLQSAERRLAREFDMVTLATPGELQAMRDAGVQGLADWFPNGVDAAAFSPSPERYEPDTISFLGRMDYFPNQQAMIEFCADVLPMLRERRPKIQVFIVGADPSPAVRHLAKLPGVTVTGAVPKVQPFILRSALTVAPLRIARGTQNKLLESMAMGVPVVASRVAAAGVDAVPGEHLLAASTPDEYRDAILRVLEDPAERARLAAAGRARVLSHHSWPSAMGRLDGIIERCIEAFSVRQRSSLQQAA